MDNKTDLKPVHHRWKPKFITDKVILVMTIGYFLTTVSTLTYLIRWSSIPKKEMAPIWITALVIILLVKLFILYRLTFYQTYPRNARRIFIFALIIVIISVWEIFFVHPFNIKNFTHLSGIGLANTLALWFQFIGTIILMIGAIAYAIKHWFIKPYETGKQSLDNKQLDE